MPTKSTQKKTKAPTKPRVRNLPEEAVATKLRIGSRLRTQDSGRVREADSDVAFRFDATIQSIPLPTEIKK